MPTSSSEALIDRRMLIRGVGSALSVLGANRAMAQTPAHFALTSVALYLPEQAMRERGPTTDALIEYIDKLKARAETVLRSSPKIPGCHAAIVVALKPPAKSRVWLASTNKTNQVLLSVALKAPLEMVVPPAVMGINAFALNFDANGGDGSVAAATLPVPDEWQQALPNGGMLPDDAVRAVWRD